MLDEVLSDSFVSPTISNVVRKGSLTSGNSAKVKRRFRVADGFFGYNTSAARGFDPVSFLPATGERVQLGRRVLAMLRKLFLGGHAETGTVTHRLPSRTKKTLVVKRLHKDSICRFN